MHHNLLEHHPMNKQLPYEMAPSTFTAYKLTPMEMLQGQVLTPLQKAVISNDLNGLAESKVNLKYDPAEPMTFVQREAELQGQINQLRYMLELSDSAEQAIVDVKATIEPETPQFTGSLFDNNPSEDSDGE